MIGKSTMRTDSNGEYIHCGDIVEYTEWREPETVTTSEDGWGRTIQLCSHDQYTEPKKELTLTGQVLYSISRAGFVVEFNEYMLGTGNKCQDLFMLLFGKRDKLVVIKKYH